VPVVGHGVGASTEGAHTWSAVTVTDYSGPLPGTIDLKQDTTMIHTMLSALRRRRDEDGASAVEYGLLVAAIAALIVVIVFALGGVIKSSFSKTCDTIASKTAPTMTSCAS
jgi:pilus assembly protein Flp/PilA